MRTGRCLQGIVLTISLECAMKENASISGEYTYHENERSYFAVGYTALF
jgi:hypothetical protein